MKPGPNALYSRRLSLSEGSRIDVEQYRMVGTMENWNTHSLYKKGRLYSSPI
jgi:hypothetical protein